MASGPSKEELEIYWQNSRQYFDELARHYQKADPEYYKNYIQPFYSNPFRSSSQRKSGSGGVKLVAVMAVIALIGIGAASLFIFVSNTPEDKSERLREKVTSDTIAKEDVIKPVEPEPEVEPYMEKSIHFRRGEKLFEDKNYTLAERYLKKVPVSDKNYKDAQRMLEIIKTMNNTKEQDNGRNKRVKPIQPVR